MRVAAALLVLLASVAVSTGEAHSASDRFSGSASLRAAPQSSADQRFTIKAELQGNRTQSGGRFDLTARLMPEAKGAKGANIICDVVGVDLFSDGFEPILNTN